MTLKSPKQKGDRWERQLAEYLSRELNITARRAPLSGGGFIETTGGADLTGVPLLFIEAKHVQRLNFHQAMAQVQRNRVLAKSTDFPAVISRRNADPTGSALVTMRLDDFLQLYRLALVAANNQPKDPAP